MLPRPARDPPRLLEQEVLTEITPEYEGTMLLINMGLRFGYITR